MMEFGFVQFLNDYSLFMYDKDNVSVFVLVYVDDILVTGNCETTITSFKNFLDNKFMIKNLGTLHYFLGIEAVSTNDGICFNQMKYNVELISEFGLSACKLASVPMDQRLKLDDVVTDKTLLYLILESINE